MIHYSKVYEIHRAGKLICNVCRVKINPRSSIWTNGTRGSGWCCTKCSKEFFKKIKASVKKNKL